MARSGKQKDGSFFLSPSSSFAKETVHVMFILMLFPSAIFSQETEEYISTVFFAKWEGECTNDRNDDAMQVLFFKNVFARAYVNSPI